MQLQNWPFNEKKITKRLNRVATKNISIYEIVRYDMRFLCYGMRIQCYGVRFQCYAMLLCTLVCVKYRFELTVGSICLRKQGFFE